MTINTVLKSGRAWTRDDLVTFRRFINAAERYGADSFYFSGDSYTVDYAKQVSKYLDMKFSVESPSISEEEKRRVTQADPVAALRSILYPAGVSCEATASISGEDIDTLVCALGHLECMADMAVRHVVMPQHTPSIVACDYHHEGPSCRDAACYIRSDRMHDLNGMRESMEAWAEKEGITMPHQVKRLLANAARIIKTEMDNGVF